MTATEILEQAFLDGVIVSADGGGKIKLKGRQVMITKWLPEIQKNKDVLLKALSSLFNNEKSIPAICGDCNRLEMVEIMGTKVAGCLYEIPGAEFSEGWKRIPEDLDRCIIH